jgi:aspartate/methionine/tyrosine aminotransferase
MDFKAYKLWQKAYLEKHPDIFRADCMNPFISMNYLLEDVEYRSQNVTQEMLYKKWQEVNNVKISSEKLVLTRGVRHSLSKLFHLFKEETIYMPQDVYPRYFELAHENRVESFVTYPKVDWQVLNGVEDSVVLLTIPFTPMGKPIDEEALKELESLLKRGNRLIIDAVYDYDVQNNFQKLEPLFKQGVVFWLHSLSKTYLSPEVLGISYVSSSAYKSYFESAFDNYHFQNEVSYGRAYDIMRSKPTLPDLQQQEFRKGFAYLSENTGLTIEQSEIAYCAVVEESFEALLERNILGVPSSVFGSQNPNLTIVTGLFYLDELYAKK